MCMKEYRCCLKFRRGDNSTYTFMKRGGRVPCKHDVQTLEYRYISKLPMKNERIWNYVKETTSHLQNKLTKNIHLGVATRSSTKWDFVIHCLQMCMKEYGSCQKFGR
jgi:hypothetical protein